MYDIQILLFRKQTSQKTATPCAATNTKAQLGDNAAASQAINRAIGPGSAIKQHL